MTPESAGTPVPLVATRLKWVDATRGVAIVLVVLGHSIQYGLPASGDPFANGLFATVYAFHMPLFMLISGYLAGLTFGHRAPSATLSARARSLLVPFATWTILSGVVAGLASAIIGDNNATNPLTWIASSLVYPEGTLWFLWALFVCHVVYTAARVAESPLARVALCAAVVALYLAPQDDLFAIAQIKWLLPFFLAGSCALKLARKLLRYEFAITWGAIVAFILLRTLWVRGDSVYLHHMHREGGVVESALRFGFRYVLAMAGAIAVVGLIRMLTRRFEMRVVRALGVASLGIYAAQTVIFRFVSQTNGPSSPLPDAAYIMVLATLVTGSAWACSRVLERLRWTRVLLLGGR